MKPVFMTFLAAFCLVFTTSCDIISPRIPTQKIEYSVVFSDVNGVTAQNTTQSSVVAVELSATHPTETRYLATYGNVDALSGKGVSFSIENGMKLSVALREANGAETLASGKQISLPSPSNASILAAFKVRVNVPDVGEADVAVNGTSQNLSGTIAINEYTQPSAGKAGRITGTITLTLVKPAITVVASGRQQLSPRDLTITNTFTCAMKAL